MKLKFMIYEVLKNEKTKVLAEIIISNAEFFKGVQEIPLFPNKKQKHTLLIEDFKLYNKFKFFDFLISQLEIKTFIFLDLTNSKINDKHWNNVNSFKNCSLVLKENNFDDVKVSNFVKDSNFKESTKTFKIVKNRNNFVKNETIFAGEDEFVSLNNTLIKYLVEFDTDSNIPVFCFGAKLSPKFDTINNCFAANKNIMEPEINGHKSFLESKYCI